MTTSTAAAPIVVGVSGSRASRAALRWAASQGRTLGAPVLAVHAWEPSFMLRAPYAPAAAGRSPEEDRVRARGVLDKAVDAARAAYPDADIRPLLTEGGPVKTLLRAADGASLLTLGRGPFQGGPRAALGPVARVCLLDARCPVVTVTADAPTAPPRVPERPLAGARSAHGS